MIFYLIFYTKSASFTNIPLISFPFRSLISLYAYSTHSLKSIPSCFDIQMRVTTVSPMLSVCFSLSPLFIARASSPSSSTVLHICTFGSWVCRFLSTTHCSIFLMVFSIMFFIIYTFNFSSHAVFI